MSAITHIRKLIYSLPEGGTFTTRDCLSFGFRSAVDRALSRLVKNGMIRRLARGVFARDSKNQTEYSDFEIAKLKAEAFGRKIIKHPSTIAKELGIRGDEAADSIFSIDGRSTKFHIEERVIQLKEMSERKMHLCQTKTGQAMCALWYLRQGVLNSALLTKAVANFNRADRVELRRDIRWMPAWLSNSLAFTRRWDPLHHRS
jgi:Family of unknown function (DUF6088)